MDTMPSGDTAQTLLIVLLLLANTLHLLVKRGGNGKHPPSLMEDGKLQQRVASLDREVEQIREWKHDLANEWNVVVGRMLPRTEAEILARESRDDRARLWAAIERLREER